MGNSDFIAVVYGSLSIVFAFVVVFTLTWGHWLASLRYLRGDEDEDATVPGGNETEAVVAPDG